MDQWDFRKLPVGCNQNFCIVLPEELLKFLDETDEDDTRIFIDSVDFSKVDPEIQLTIIQDSYEDEEGNQQSWLLTIKKHRAIQVHSKASSQLEIVVDHPLLLDHIDQQCSLYYSGQCADPYKLFVDLFQAHLEVCGLFIPFTKYLNNEKDFISVFKATSALVANGPKRLLQRYGQCLEQHNLSYKIIGSRLPGYWDGEKYIEANEDIKLLLVGESFFVGEDFVFTKNGNSR